MKIAQVSPLYESVPPKLYGGTERVVHYLTEQLHKQGHDVTLFASGDSETSAKLISVKKKATRLDPETVDGLASHFLLIETVEKYANQFDIIHSHIDYLYFPLIKRNKPKYITTLHGRLDIPELKPLYREYSTVPVVSISDEQRKPLPYANWISTVYHGLPSEMYQYNEGPGEYLAFVGRVSPEKRIDRVIEVAIMTGIPVKIAAKVDKADQDYFEQKIRPMLKHPLVEFIGEINDSEKNTLLGKALALLYLIDWPEPFGLAMIESMACGTPVIAFKCGSVPEVVDNGLTGYVVTSLSQAAKAVKNLNLISRENCRKTFDQRFSSERMANDYIKLYQYIRGTSTDLDGTGLLKSEKKLTA
jgi:glycosyltransferase involved in cell wall biosynthesis